MNISKSTLFTAYNKARVCGLDRKRVNRALGYIQAGRVALLENGTAIVSGSETYYVTKDGCDCPDHKYRGSDCKHMVARWLLLKIEVLNGPEPTPEPPAPPAPPMEQETTLEADIAELWGA